MKNGSLKGEADTAIRRDPVCEALIGFCWNWWLSSCRQQIPVSPGIFRWASGPRRTPSAGAAPLRPAPVPSSILPLGCGFFLSWEVSPLSLSNDAVISVSLHLSMSNESWSATELCWWWVGVKNKRRGDGGTWTGRGNAHQIRGGDSLKPFFLKLFQQWNECLCVWQVCLLIIRWNSGFIVC